MIDLDDCNRAYNVALHAYLAEHPDPKSIDALIERDNAAGRAAQAAFDARYAELSGPVCANCEHGRGGVLVRRTQGWDCTACGHITLDPDRCPSCNELISEPVHRGPGFCKLPHVPARSGVAR